MTWTHKDIQISKNAADTFQRQRTILSKQILHCKK